MMVQVSLLQLPRPRQLIILLRDFILLLLCTVTVECLNLCAASILVIRDLSIKLVWHEVLFLNVHKDVIFIHKRLERLFLLQYRHVLGRRAVGILLDSCLLLNIDYVR